MRLLAPATLLSLLLLSGCSLEQRLETVSEKIRQQFADAKSWEQLPLRVISWQQAMSMMERCNAKLETARSSIAEAERDGLSVYTDMIPGISYYGYLTKSIKQLSNELSVNDLKSDVNITFFIPSLTQVPYRTYAAKASTFAAIKALEGTQRELMSTLYKTVRTRELTLRLRDLTEKSPDLTEQDRMLAVKNNVTEDASHWMQMAELLGDYSARWQVLPSSVPKVSWSRYESKLDKLDDLVVCAYALRLEQARLAQYQIALIYLPTINTSLYSPSLFSSSGGTYEGSFLSGEDTRINLSLSYSIDTQLSTWNSYKKSKQRYEATKKEVIVGVIEHKNKLQTLKASIREYFNWRSYMLKRIDYLSKLNAMTATELIERDRTILDMKKELISQEIQSVDSEAAVLLEYGIDR